MKWYEILGLVVIVIAGAWLRGKMYENNRKHSSGYNDSWWDRKKK